jgi:hypothetical protein
MLKKSYFYLPGVEGIQKFYISNAKHIAQRDDKSTKKGEVKNVK